MRASLKSVMAVVAVLSTGCWMARNHVSSADAHRLVAGGALLLDVRSPSEYQAGHIDGAVNIPVNEVEARLGEIGSKERSIVVYCASGKRSGRAAEALQRAGYTAVHDLGPMSRW